MSPNAIIVNGIVDLEDGFSVDVEVTEEFVDYYKKVTGKKRVHEKSIKKFAENFVREAIESTVSEDIAGINYSSEEDVRKALAARCESES